MPILISEEARPKLMQSIQTFSAVVRRKGIYTLEKENREDN